jgi:hypothetical protein
MCDRRVAAGHVAQAGLNVIEVLCQGCSLAKVCGDHRQRSEAEELAKTDAGAKFLLDANYKFLHPPVCRAPIMRSSMTTC